MIETNIETTDHIETGVTVDLDRLERAAQVLAVASSHNWGNADVRNRYRGLALTTIGAYLAPGDAGSTKAGERS